MAEETWLNCQRLIENAKGNSKQTKKDQKERREQVEYDRCKGDQHHKIEMVRYQAIFNQREIAIMQEKEKIL